MKVVLLAGGFGTRISEESHLRPKPMIEIGGKPILWHIMKSYSSYGFNDFIICCGYKAHVIKEYFANYYLHTSDITFDFSNKNETIIHNNFSEKWKVTLVDTGLNTMTGGRIKRIQKYIGNESFMLTYGDGVSDVDIKKIVNFHETHGKIATLTAVNIGQQFGILDIDKNNNINSFREKSMNDGYVINGGFMVLTPKIFDFINGDDTIFEQIPLQTVASMGELKAYKHDGFWKCMDSQRDKQQLEELWQKGDAPWKRW